MLTVTRALITAHKVENTTATTIVSQGALLAWLFLAPTGCVMSYCYRPQLWALADVSTALFDVGYFP
jgi:hypothetical protein